MTELVDIVQGHRRAVRAEVVRRTESCVQAVEVGSGRMRFVEPAEARAVKAHHRDTEAQRTLCSRNPGRGGA
jgi:hypothetical protein